MPPVTRRNFTSAFHHDTYAALQEKVNCVSVAGKSVFITGSGSGIGRATAFAFAQAGAHAVFLSGRTAASLLETKKAIEEKFPETLVQEFIFDISEGLEKVDSVFSEASKLARGGHVDVLINNAADLSSIPTVEESYHGSAVSTTHFERYWRHFEVNVKGSLALATAFLRHAPRTEPIIINTTSGAAVLDFVPGLSGYGVSKMAALKMFSYLWYEQQDVGRALKVFHIHPGIVPTGMAKEGKSNTEDTG